MGDRQRMRQPMTKDQYPTLIKVGLGKEPLGGNAIHNVALPFPPTDDRAMAGECVVPSYIKRIEVPPCTPRTPALIIAPRLPRERRQRIDEVARGLV